MYQVAFASAARKKNAILKLVIMPLTQVCHHHLIVERTKLIEREMAWSSAMCPTERPVYYERRAARLRNILISTWYRSDRNSVYMKNIYAAGLEHSKACIFLA